MMKELYFALYAIKKNIQSSAELRTSFLMNIVGMSINNTAFIILWGFFVKSVGVIGGWTVADIIGLQGFVAICFGIYAFLIHATIYQILLIGLLVIISTVVFLAAAIAIYSTSFFFTDASSVTGSLFELFLTPSLFHGGAFQGAMRFIFTFAIPSLLIGALPVEIVRDISLGKLLLVGVLAIFWFVVSINIFNRAIKKYESSNFMTFGN